MPDLKFTTPDTPTMADIEVLRQRLLAAMNQAFTPDDLATITARLEEDVAKGKRSAGGLLEHYRRRHAEEVGIAEDPSNS